VTNDNLQPWSVTARNLAEHAANAIHTDPGAQAAGFPSALVAGVTTYAYLTHPLVAAWGLDWVEHGGGEVRFLAPVFAGRSIDCVPATHGDDVAVIAVDATEPRNPRATLRAVRAVGPPTVSRDGEVLPPREFVLDGRYGTDYGARAGDDLDSYGLAGVVHPAVWPALANNIFATDLVRGAWIHTRSVVRHHGLVPGGAVVTVYATVVERSERRGQRAVADVLVAHEGRTVVTLEHEAIIDLAA
jgi:acyl dehydratase